MKVGRKLSFPKEYKVAIDPDPNFRERAACLGVNTELFFPPPGNRGGSRDYKEAIQICKGCPVTRDCLETALSWGSGSQAGVFGGLAPQNRRNIISYRHKNG